MSIYASAGFPVPMISYTIIHGPAPGVPRGEYEDTIREMHRRVEEESTAVNKQEAKQAAENTARQAQMARGTLSHFLQTPIRSDDEEVRKIFLESFEKFREQAGEGGPYGVVASMEGAVAAIDAPAAPLKQMDVGGRRYLKTLGFAFAKSAPAAYESLYLVRGGTNLDVIEHIVRDRLGIYASAHGKHIKGSADFAVGVHNLVHASGADYWKSVSGAWGEGVLFFSKPEVPYDQFRAGLTPRIEEAGAAAGIAATTLWQRKLGLGRGKEFALRFLLADRDQLARFTDRLRTIGDPPFFRSTLLGAGSLILKTLLDIK